MGYVRGVVHGALVGACLGLLYAPEAGRVTRQRVARWLQEAEGILSSGRPEGSAPPRHEPGVASRAKRTPAS